MWKVFKKRDFFNRTSGHIMLLFFSLNFPFFILTGSLSDRNVFRLRFQSGLMFQKSTFYENVIALFILFFVLTFHCLEFEHLRSSQNYYTVLT